MNIEIGKRYRLEIRPNPEYCCEECKVNFGEAMLSLHPEFQGMIVTVMLIPEGQRMRCSPPKGCNRVVPYPEGILHIGSPSLEPGHLAVPYTWLIPIDD